MRITVIDDAIPAAAPPATQLELFEIAPVERKGKSIEDAFNEFHALNPHVYRNLRALALTAARGGRRRLGIRLLWERLRWEYFMKTSRPEGEFMLNDHYHSRYARMLMDKEPELAGMFEVRELKSLKGSRRKIITIGA